MSTAHDKQQEELNKIANEISKTNDLWKEGDFGGVATGPTSRSRNNQDFGGLVREEKLSLRPADFTDADFEELARRDPKFKAKLNEQRMDAITDAFRKATPQYLSTQANYDAMLNYIRNAQLQVPLLDLDDVIEQAYSKGLWSVENLTTVFRHLKARGRLDLPAEQPKELTSEEQLIVVAKVRAGNPSSAILTYLAFSLPRRDVSNLSIEDFATEYPALMHRCVWFIFRAMHPELATDEFKSFAQSMSHVALPTVALLDQALYSKKEEKYLASLSPGSAPIPAPPSPKPQQRELTDDELRALPPEELDKLIAQERKATIKRIYNM